MRLPDCLDPAEIERFLDTFLYREEAFLVGEIVRWDEGGSGFGNRIHHADFKHLARLGPPPELLSEETRSRAGRKRVVLRYAFRFEQQGDLVYLGDQTAMCLRDAALE